MNATEAALLCRYAHACSPATAIDEYTPAAWAELLADIRLEDARAAVVAVSQRQPFIAPAEIIAEVRRIRGKRIATHPPLVPPPGLDEREERAWLGAARARIGNGETIDCTYGELTRRDMRALLTAPVATP